MAKETNIQDDEKIYETEDGESVEIVTQGMPSIPVMPTSEPNFAADFNPDLNEDEIRAEVADLDVSEVAQKESLNPGQNLTIAEGATGSEVSAFEALGIPMQGDKPKVIKEGSTDICEKTGLFECMVDSTNKSKGKAYIAEYLGLHKVNMFKTNKVTPQGDEQEAYDNYRKIVSTIGVTIGYFCTARRMIKAGYVMKTQPGIDPTQIKFNATSVAG